MQEKIEILPVTLLDGHRPTVIALKRLARTLGMEFGWHYLLDLTWVLSQLDKLKGRRILDAGAGVGILQWFLVEAGADVISVDRESRAHLPLHFRLRYRVRGLRERDLQPLKEELRYRSATDQKLITNGSLAAAVTGGIRDIARIGVPQRLGGQVSIYNQDLNNLLDIPDASLDAVVGISALEHNPPQDMGAVVTELLRVLKPGGLLLATLCAAPDQDMFHEPSKGWCYSAATLRGFFDLPADTPSNYDSYADLFEALRNCAELRDHLAGFYARSGDNGMPWGIWDPQYQPVGVCKVKRAG